MGRRLEFKPEGETKRPLLLGQPQLQQDVAKSRNAQAGGGFISQLPASRFSPEHERQVGTARVACV
jgi:hypothetical protein